MPVSPSGYTCDIPLSAGSRAVVAASTTAYLGPVGEAATPAGAVFIMPYPGILNRAWFNVSVAPGAGLTVTFTVFKNGAATGLTAAVTGATQMLASDLVHAVPVAAGDLVCIQVAMPAVATAPYCAANLSLTA